VVASMTSCRDQASRICAARLMSALTPAARQIGWLRVFLACYHDTAVRQSRVLDASSDPWL
jgi:hypothetical protein